MPVRLRSGMGLVVVPHRLGAWQGAGGATLLRALDPAETPSKGAVVARDCIWVYCEGWRYAGCAVAPPALRDVGVAAPGQWPCGLVGARPTAPCWFLVLSSFL